MGHGVKDVHKKVNWPGEEGQRDFPKKVMAEMLSTGQEDIN